jgi:hypothetical protein
MLMNSGLFSQNLNCRTAPRTVVKRAIKNNKKSVKENHRAALNSITHITLLCCIGAVPGDPQKTPVLGPRHISRGLWKALMYNRHPCRSSLLSSYINGLISRYRLAPTLPRER